MSNRDAANRNREREQILNNINNLIVVRGGRRIEGDNLNVHVHVQAAGLLDMAGRGDEHRAPAGGRGEANNPTSRNNSSGFSNSGAGSNKRKCMTYGPESVESWASTEVEQESFSFLWNLKGYSAFTGSEEVKSPIFRGGPKSLHYWQLKMSPKKKFEDQEYFAVHLILTSFGDSDNSSTRKLKVRFQISILDSDGRPGKQAGSATMNVCEFKKCSVWGYDKFILASDLVAPSRRLVEDDQLKIHCRVWIEGELKHKTGNGGAASNNLPSEDRSLRQKDRICEEFGSLRTTADFADVAVTTNNRTFMAHKAILAARSKVFAAMFGATMVEAALNSVEILDFDEDIVDGMLEYMYTAQVESLADKAPDLLQIAEKYDLQGLKEECEHQIAENLTVDNAADVLVMAHLYNASILKPKVIDFINRNKEDVRKTKAFQKITQGNPDVFVELYLSQ